jgi:hypothetical protein
MGCKCLDYTIDPSHRKWSNQKEKAFRVEWLSTITTPELYNSRSYSLDKEPIFGTFAECSPNRRRPAIFSFLPWRDIIHFSDGGFPCEFSSADYFRIAPSGWRSAHRLWIDTAYWRIQFRTARH